MQVLDKQAHGLTLASTVSLFCTKQLFPALLELAFKAQAVQSLYRGRHFGTHHDAIASLTAAISIANPICGWSTIFQAALLCRNQETAHLWLEQPVGLVRS